MKRVGGHSEAYSAECLKPPPASYLPPLPPSSTTQVRKTRPKNEATEDGVQTELVNMDGILRHNLAQLLHCQKGINTDVARLRQAKRQLEDDLRNKKTALEVDRRVLLDETTEATNFGKSGSTGLGKPRNVRAGLRTPLSHSNDGTTQSHTHTADMHQLKCVGARICLVGMWIVGEAPMSMWHEYKWRATPYHQNWVCGSKTL